MEVRDHHHPRNAPRTTLTDVVHVADAIVHAADREDDATECVPAVDEAAWSRAELGDEGLATLLRCAESAWHESTVLTD